MAPGTEGGGGAAAGQGVPRRGEGGGCVDTPWRCLRPHHGASRPPGGVRPGPTFHPCSVPLLPPSTLHLSPFAVPSLLTVFSAPRHLRGSHTHSTRPPGPGRIDTFSQGGWRSTSPVERITMRPLLPDARGSTSIGRQAPPSALCSGQPERAWPVRRGRLKSLDAAATDRLAATLQRRACARRCRGDQPEAK